METTFQKIIKRLKSLLWRFGMVVAAVVINTAIENLSGFGLGTELTVVLGLVLGEVSKYLNNYIVKYPVVPSDSE